MYRTLVKSRLVWGLSLLTACPTGLSAQTQSDRLAQLRLTDPNGFVLTMTAVMVVFLALALLIVFFKCLGRFMQSISKRNEPQTSTSTLYATPSERGTQPSGEVAVAVAMALRAHQVPSAEVAAAIALSVEDFLCNSHDHESYKLTIRSRSTQWNHRGQMLRRSPY